MTIFCFWPLLHLVRPETEPTSKCSGTNVDGCNTGPRPQNLLTLLILSGDMTQFELFVAASRLLAVYPPQTCRLQKEEQLKHFCFVYWRATPSLSLGVVTANKGSNKSTEWSLLATIQLIIADTWDRWKEWYHNDFITVNGVRKAGKWSERLTILWFIDFQWRCKTVGKLLGWGGLTIIIKKINYYININALPCVINVFFQLFFGMRKKGNPHPICLNV